MKKFPIFVFAATAAIVACNSDKKSSPDEDMTVPPQIRFQAPAPGSGSQNAQVEAAAKEISDLFNNDKASFFQISELVDQLLPDGSNDSKWNEVNAKTKDLYNQILSLKDQGKCVVKQNESVSPNGPGSFQPGSKTTTTKNSGVEGKDCPLNARKNDVTTVKIKSVDQKAGSYSAYMTMFQISNANIPSAKQNFTSTMSMSGPMVRVGSDNPQIYTRGVIKASGTLGGGGVSMECSLEMLGQMSSSEVSTRDHDLGMHCTVKNLSNGHVLPFHAHQKIKGGVKVIADYWMGSVKITKQDWESKLPWMNLKD